VVSAGDDALQVDCYPVSFEQALSSKPPDRVHRKSRVLGGVGPGWRVAARSTIDRLRGAMTGGRALKRVLTGPAKAWRSYSREVLGRPARNTESPLFFAVTLLTVFASMTLTPRWFLLTSGLAMVAVVAYSWLRLLRRTGGWADRRWELEVSTPHFNRFAAGIVVAGVHTAHVAMVGVEVLWLLSVGLYHADAAFRSWPDALIAVLSAVQLDVGTAASPTSVAGRACTAMASLVGLGFFAMLLSALTRVFDRTFSFEGATRNTKKSGGSW
jgi:hypothetical protein